MMIRKSGRSAQEVGWKTSRVLVEGHSKTVMKVHSRINVAAVSVHTKSQVTTLIRDKGTAPESAHWNRSTCSLM